MLRPIGKRIVIKPLEDKQNSIIIHNKKPNKFVVVWTGDEVLKVGSGDIVYLEKHRGADIEHEGEKYIVIEQDDILAVIEIAYQKPTETSGID